MRVTNPCTTSQWVELFKNINPARHPKGGFAPHKPLLLVCIMDAVVRGQIRVGERVGNPRMLVKDRYTELWTASVSDRIPKVGDVRLPLYHLKTQGLWRALGRFGAEASSPSDLVAIDIRDDLMDSMSDRLGRAYLLMALTETYFSTFEAEAIHDLFYTWQVKQ